MTLYLVVCAATPLRRIGELTGLLVADGWDVQVIATPAAATWPFLDTVEESTGHPVLHRMPPPDEPWPVTRPDAVLLAPATFNTINKLATGVNDNLALNVLNENLGAPIPMLLAAHVKPELRSHPAFKPNRNFLTAAGVTWTDLTHPLNWPALVALLQQEKPPRPRI